MTCLKQFWTLPRLNLECHGQTSEGFYSFGHAQKILSEGSNDNAASGGSGGNGWGSTIGERWGRRKKKVSSGRGISRQNLVLGAARLSLRTFQDRLRSQRISPFYFRCTKI